MKAETRKHNRKLL